MQQEMLDLFAKYSIMPTYVSRNKDLSITAKTVYAYLLSFVDAKQMKEGKLKAWPGRRRMANELNLSESTLQKYINELKEAGLITVLQSRKKLPCGRQVYGNNIYIFHTKLPKEAEKETKQEIGVAENSQYLVPGEDELAVEKLIAHWNSLGVNNHTRIGKKTKQRLALALNEALEDFTFQELLDTLTIYARVYQRGRCQYKYRLVEFMEKAAYEHFTSEANWQRQRYYYRS